MKASKANPQDTKWVFLKKGTCSQTLFYILNREFDNSSEPEERATDPLAGGIMQQGYQCGMLWGSSMAAGAEAFKRCSDCGKATALAIRATQNLIDSFTARTKSPDCLDITSADFNKKLGIAKYLFSGKAINCFKLADKWAPEAIKTAAESLACEQADHTTVQPVNCASEVVKKMGASEKEQVMVAGFAGGLGLSGNACGALSAALWMNSLKWCREHPGKSGYHNPAAAKTMEAFLPASDYEFLCHKITGKRFKTTGDHTEFIRNGGCEKVINALAQVYGDPLGAAAANLPAQAIA
jgi:hypothetical protein